MEFTQYIKYKDGDIKSYKYFSISCEGMIEMLKRDLSNYSLVVATWVDDENGDQIVYFDKNTQLIKGEEQLKKATKEEILDKIYFNVSATKNEINQILEQLEKKGYIKFKKEPKTYKVFVKIVSINGENKRLYYVTDFHLTENIDEAKRFGLDEEKDGYAYECVKEY